MDTSGYATMDTDTVWIQIQLYLDKLQLSILNKMELLLND